MLQKVVIEMLNHASFRQRVEIDQHVATQDEVHALHEQYDGIFQQVEPAEIDNRLQLRLHSELAPVEQEVLTTKNGLNIAGAVVVVDSRLGVRERAFIQVRGQNFGGPTVEVRLLLLKYDHGQRICLFSSRTPGTPNAELPLSELGFRLNDLRQDDFSDCINLIAIAKEAGLTDGDFV